MKYETTTLDAGHRYVLPSLDGEVRSVLQFVKRHDPLHPERFPGNTNSYPGTTLQAVIRVLLSRLDYLQGQIWCVENAIVRRLLHLCLWLLEFRAARRHGRGYWHSPNFAATDPMCAKCGHTACGHTFAERGEV